MIITVVKIKKKKEKKKESAFKHEVWFISVIQEQKPLLQSVYRNSSDTLGSKQHQTNHHSTASFLFPVHTGSCLFAWSRRRSWWGCVGLRRKSWRSFLASMPALSLRPGQGSMTWSVSSKIAYWRSRRRQYGWSRTSCEHTHTYTCLTETKENMCLRITVNTTCNVLFYILSYLYSG